MSIEVIMSESVMNATKDVVYKVIVELSARYDFDSEEAIRSIGLSMKSKDSKVKELKVKELKVKSKFALPYSGELVESCCRGLRQNQGLYTQCTVSSCESSVFCKSCKTSADKNDGVPEYGTITSRLKAYNEGVEYKDPSGKSPTPYVKVMKKLKVSREEVEEEASKLWMVINPIHFETDAVKRSGRPALKKKAEVGEVKPKGRPKKAKKVLELAGEEEDLFASLVMSANKQNDSEDEQDEDADTVIMSDSEGEDEKETTILAAKLLADEEAKLAAKLVADEEAKLSAKLSAKLVADEEAKLSAKLSAKLVSDEEKEVKKKAADAKKETERLEKEAKKKAVEDEKEAKKLAADAKKEAERLEKEGKKKVVEVKKPKKEGKKKADEVTNGVEEEDDEVVKNFVFEGKKYLKSKKAGIIYNMEQDKIGKWNEAKQRIDFDIIEEESCDEYDA